MIQEWLQKFTKQTHRGSDSLEQSIAVAMEHLYIGVGQAITDHALHVAR